MLIVLVFLHKDNMFQTVTKYLYQKPFIAKHKINSTSIKYNVVQWHVDESLSE